MKNNKAMVLRQYIGTFLVALMLVISFLSSPIVYKNTPSSPVNNSTQHQFDVIENAANFEFTEIKNFATSFIKIPTFSKIAEKLSEQTYIILNDIYFIPYPQALTVNNFLRNVFYVFISTKAP